MMNDLRYAWRQLVKSPGFSLTAILTLGLAIGANTAVFSLVDAVLIKSLPSALITYILLWYAPPPI